MVYMFEVLNLQGLQTKYILFFVTDHSLTMWYYFQINGKCTKNLIRVQRLKCVFCHYRHKKMTKVVLVEFIYYVS